MYVCDRLSSILQIKPVMEILGDNKKKRAVCYIYRI